MEKRRSNFEKKKWNGFFGLGSQGPTGRGLKSYQGLSSYWDSEMKSWKIFKLKFQIFPPKQPVFEHPAKAPSHTHRYVISYSFILLLRNPLNICFTYKLRYLSFILQILIFMCFLFLKQEIGDYCYCYIK